MYWILMTLRHKTAEYCRRLISYVDKAHANTAARVGPVGQEDPPSWQTTKMFCWFFRAGLHAWLFYDKTLTGSVLWDLGITSLIIIAGGGGEDGQLSSLLGLRPVINAIRSGPTRHVVRCCTETPFPKLHTCRSLHSLHSIITQQWKFINIRGPHTVAWCRCPVRDSPKTTASSSKVIVPFLCRSRQILGQFTSFRQRPVSSKPFPLHPHQSPTLRSR
jgi:hypothetical protein